MEGIAVEDIATTLVDIFYGKGILPWVVRLYNAQTMLQPFLLRVETKPVVSCSILLGKLLVLDKVHHNVVIIAKQPNQSS